tara:strand:+ start:870 stop:1118 length:249 start_codon:yes stop_codon:yes gene_type:complete
VLELHEDIVAVAFRIPFGPALQREEVAPAHRAAANFTSQIRPLDSCDTAQPPTRGAFGRRSPYDRANTIAREDEDLGANDAG